MNSHYTYLLIDVLSVLFPFLFSFEKKIVFYKQWRFLLPAMMLTAVFFIAWDVWFTGMGVWSFNDGYIIGYKLLQLPIEEWLFFICIPYSCAFIYECVLYYFKLREKDDWGWKVLLYLGVLLLITGFLNSYKAYTFTAFAFCGIALIVLYLLRSKVPVFHAAGFVVTYFISLLPFFIVNGFLTALPVVQYNDAENLNIRLYTIPVEDSFYGMLLLLCNIAGMEWLRGKRINKALPSS